MTVGLKGKTDHRTLCQCLLWHPLWQRWECKALEHRKRKLT